jgi:predicted ABC-type ATPase
MGVPRLRIFAGPNGSGKSTIKTVISDSLLGHYLNPDEIEKEVKRIGQPHQIRHFLEFQS